MYRFLAACCVSIELAITVLIGVSSLNGAEVIRFTCRTADGNNSHVSCTVPYNNTELVLNCPGDERYQLVWAKGDCTSFELGSRPCHNVTGRNCYINDQPRTLTNDDSGTYCCRESVVGGTEYHSIHINVTAPPEFNIDSPVRSYTSKSTKVSINISYFGNGPFTVQWKHNNTEFNCSENNDICVYMMDDPIKKTSELLLRNDVDDVWKISGTYTVIVTNPYGTRETTVYVYYSCTSKTLPYAVNKTLNLMQGRPFRKSCNIRALARDVSHTIVCLTRNTSYKLEELLHPPSGERGNCVSCSINNEETCQPHTLNGTIGTNMKFSSDESKDTSDYCSIPLQRTNFGSDSALMSYDGLTVICAYRDIDLSLKEYAYFYLKVEPSKNKNILTIIVSLVAGGVALAMLIILCIIVGCCCWHQCRTVKRKDREDNNYARIVIDSSISSDEGERHDESAPLMPESVAECRERFESIPYEGSIGPGAVFPRELVGKNSETTDI